MEPKKHLNQPHLTGEHRWGDTGQLILLFIFMAIWITDSFIFNYSISLTEVIPNAVRMPVALVVFGTGGWLAYRGMKSVFGTERDAPGVITTGVFRHLRHPIYTGALLFYLGAVISTLSLTSALFWLVILVFYYFISRYEERILTQEFGQEYLNYMEHTGMLFPKIFR
jgi:protein-S-isoprenylcysteine O-methyltransferase Ste14